MIQQVVSGSSILALLYHFHDSILKLGGNDGVIFLEDLWILLQSAQESLSLLQLRSYLVGRGSWYSCHGRETS